MKIKTQDLIGPPLDWAVAKAQDIHVEVTGIYRYLGRVNQELVGFRCYAGERNEFGAVEFTPSTDWSQGGPIIEREQLTINYYGFDNPPYWSAQSLHLHYPKQFGCVGPTMLIAAMRCYVASKLGDEVDVPEELLDKM